MKTFAPNVQDDLESMSPTDWIKFLHIKTTDKDGQVIHFRLTNRESQSWLSQNWVNSPYQLIGLAHKSSGEVSRPKLNLPNPEGQLSFYVSSGALEGAEVTEYTVSPVELLADTYNKQFFIVSHVVSIQENVVTIELRRATDGNRFTLPARRFVQPEFPSVRV